MFWARESGDYATAAWLERMKTRKVYALRAEMETTYPAATVVDALEEALAKREKENVPGAGGDADGERDAAEKNGENTAPADRPLQSLVEVRAFLLAEKDRFFRETDGIRVNGPSLEIIGDPNIRNHVEYCWHQQQRFPLDTAHAMRGKFKHHRLHLFKRGKKGITYLCGVARKFRTATHELAAELDRIVRFIETSPMVSPGDVADRLAENGDREAVLKALAWLVREGYVTEFEDGSLITYPILASRGPGTNVPARKNSVPSSPGKVEDEPQGGEEEGCCPEADHQTGFRAATQLEMVVDGGHAEDAPAAGEFEEIDLADDGEGFQDKNAADDGEHEGLLDQQCHCSQEAADGEGSGIAHENGCGGCVVPKESD
jgi:hypothetical protein